MHSLGCLMDDPYIDNATERSMNEQTRKALELARDGLKDLWKPLFGSLYIDGSRPAVVVAIQKAIAAIDTAMSAPAAPVAPAGWALVPVEPTLAMRRAGFGWGTSSSTWKHMLAAAPAAPVAQPLVESVINAARAAMDESTEAYDAEMSIKIPSHLAASLSLCLDEYDRAHGIGQGCA